MLRSKISSHVLVAGSAWASRLVSAAAQVISIPILFASLGVDGYGSFALLIGLTGWYAVTDVGLGTSLQNYISECRAGGEQYRAYVAATGAFAGGLLIAGIALLYCLSPILATHLLKSFPQLSAAQKTDAFFAAGVLSICTTIGGIGFRIWYAEHRGYVANLFIMLGAVGGLIGVLAVNRLAGEHRLILSLLAYLAPGAVLALIALFRCLCKHRTTSMAPERLIVARIVRRAWRFWVVTLLSALVLQVDYIVISQLLLASDVATYSLVSKVFGLMFFGYSAMLGSLWPVFAEARAAGRWDQISQIAKRYLTSGTAFTAIATLCLVGAMPRIVHVLAHGSGIVVSTSLILLMGIYYVIRVWTDMYTTILQCGNDVRVFWLYVPLQAIAGVVLQWVFASRYGLRGIMLGLIGSFALTAVWVLPLAVKRGRRAQMTSQLWVPE